MNSFADWLESEGIEPELDVLFVSPAQFARSPQKGTPTRMTWSAFADYLSRPSVGDAKGIAGGFSPALYLDEVRRKENLVRIQVLVIDIDGNGDVDRVADEVAQYDAICLETFSSTNDDPRCRLLLRLAEPVDARTYELAHALVRSKLRNELEVHPDDGAKDASRLSYAPVRRPGAQYRFRVTRGRPVSAVQLVASIPPAPPRPPPIVVRPEHRDAYRQGALRSAVDAVASASAGARHETLNREVWSLARLGLTEDEIRAALLPTAVAVMGDGRRSEAERTIRDAYRARKGAAA
jgi:hypothetical protein